jgi:predicted component of type VI protein secretion system
VSILSDFEDRVSSAVEGVFAGVFRAPVQPAEIARACAKEMDRRRKLGVGKVYAPTLYSVLLSPADGDQLGGFADTLAGELSTYLTGYARERDYLLSAKPVVRFLIDDELKLGRYVVIGELLSPEEIAAELGETPTAEDAGKPQASEGRTPATSIPHAPAAEPIAAPAFFDAEAHAADELPPASTMATITVPGVAHDIVLRGERMVIGRLKACDVCLGDANASRQHAAIESEGTGWALVDLGSTNGTLVNGAKVDRVRLRDGDVITVGISELMYHEPRG